MFFRECFPGDELGWDGIEFVVVDTFFFCDDSSEIFVLGWIYDWVEDEI